MICPTWNQGFADIHSSHCTCLLCSTQSFWGFSSTCRDLPWIMQYLSRMVLIQTTCHCEGYSLFGTANTATLCSKTDGAAWDCSSALHSPDCSRITPHCKKFISFYWLFISLKLCIFCKLREPMCLRAKWDQFKLFHCCYSADADWVRCQLWFVLTCGYHESNKWNYHLLSQIKNK